MEVAEKKRMLDNAQRFFEINLAHLDGTEDAHRLNMEITELAMDYRKQFLEEHDIGKEEMVIGCMVGIYMYIASAHIAHDEGGDMNNQMLTLGANMQVNARALLELGQALLEEE